MRSWTKNLEVLTKESFSLCANTCRIGETWEISHKGEGKFQFENQILTLPWKRRKAEHWALWRTSKSNKMPAGIITHENSGDGELACQRGTLVLAMRRRFLPLKLHKLTLNNVYIWLKLHLMQIKLGYFLLMSGHWKRTCCSLPVR